MNKSDIEKFLVQQAFEFRHDPLGFVKFAWNDINPHDWQSEVLTQIGDKLQSGELTTHEAIQQAVASGHGIGKSCLVSWLILWSICTCVDTKGVVTANTENQLKTKTWAEVAKWYSLWRYKHWFKLTATALFSEKEEHEKTWRIDMIPWSERNTEAFAGMHNAGKRVLLVFDEASAIPDQIWEVSEGALTDADTEIIWVAFGNPTRNTGRFRECFGRFKHRWINKQIDSRLVPGTNKKQIQEWIDDYGEDSDFVRVRVRGVFPQQGSNQFISSANIEACRHYHAEGYEGLPKILAVDVARFGDDQSVIGIRQGRKVYEPKKFRGLDTMQLADKIIEMANDENPEAIVVDGVGVGAGVIDRLRQLRYNPIEFNGGTRADDPVAYRNRRCEVWGLMRDAINEGLELPNDRELIEELGSVEYGFTPTQQIYLEKKEDMKKRGLSSPDVADWLSMTFGVKINAKRKPKRTGFVGSGSWM